MRRTTMTLLLALLLVPACDDGEASCPSDMDDTEIEDAVADGYAAGITIDGCIIDPWSGIMACQTDSVHVVYVDAAGYVQTWSAPACSEQYSDIVSTQDEPAPTCSME